MLSFARALLDRERPPPGGAAPRRFAVYRNNVQASLVEALAARFPVTRSLVGDAFFRAMAALYVARRPPRSPLLATYGDDLPGFLETFPPARPVPYLADVARLEAACTDAFHAADAAAVTPAELAALGPSGRLALHPAARILRSPFPIVSIWTAHRAAESGPIRVAGPEVALVTRPAFEVGVAALTPGGAAFLDAIAEHGSLLGAAVAGFAAEPAFDIGQCLMRARGALVRRAADEGSTDIGARR